MDLVLNITRAISDKMIKQIELTGMKANDFLNRLPYELWYNGLLRRDFELTIKKGKARLIIK
jgi:hypothetical protein